MGEERKGKRFSILGDSISTFEGYTPSKAVFFDRYNEYETGIRSVEDTWWMKVIRYYEGELGYNHSLSGCCVAGGGDMEGRIRELGRNGEPEVILIFMGLNDWAFGVNPSVFREEYRDMLRGVRNAYPDAEVWCATLPEGRPADPMERFFFNIDGLLSKRLYSEIIIKLAAEEGAKAAELCESAQEYDTIDGAHPNRDGMQTLADFWIQAMEKGDAK